MASAPEIRRRQQQVSEASTSQRRDEKPRLTALSVAKTPISFFVRNLPLILSVQVLFLVLIISDPFGLRRERRGYNLLSTAEYEQIKPVLGIADVEQITTRVAINETVLVLVVPNGYTDFLTNWLKVTSDHTDLEGKFLILAEDEETFSILNSTYPRNAIFRIDVRGPSVDPEACTTPNKKLLEAMLNAYRKVVYAREIMNAGHNVLLCDVTAVWAQNPFPHFITADTYLTLGEVDKTQGQKLLVDFPTKTVFQLQPPLPRGVGKLPPVSDEIVFFQNNVGSWVTLDYWAVFLDAHLSKECNATAKRDKGSDIYTTGASMDALNGAVSNTVHLTPRPQIGLMPPGRFPPPTIFFEDASWRNLIEKDLVVVRTKLGVDKKKEMKARLEQIGLWRI